MSYTFQGPSNITVGSDGYFSFTGNPSLANCDRIYFSPSSSQEGVDYIVNWFGGNGNPAYLDNGRQWYVVTGGEIWGKVTIKSDSLAGPLMIPVSFSYSSPEIRTGNLPEPSESYKVWIEIKEQFQLPLEIELPLDTWASQMVALGNRWNDPTQTYGFGDEGEVWYYDGARIYWQIGDYLHSNLYDAVAWNIARQYRDYVKNSGGLVPGWRVFPKGLAMAWNRSRDPSYAEALMSLSNAPYVSSGGDPDPQYIRETAYAVDTWLELAKMGHPVSPMLTRGVSFLLGHFDMLFEQELGKGIGAINQPFFAGLAAEALIGYYEFSHDSRVVPAIGMMIEYISKHGINHGTGQIYYDMWDESRGIFTSLNNLICPAWAWYYRITGDKIVRDEGDMLFENAFIENPNWSGKVFCQLYRWSFDYVRWRG